MFITYCGKIYIKLTISTMFKHAFGGVKYMHVVVQPSPLSVSRTLELLPLPKLKLYAKKRTSVK